ncbi:MAG: class I SAM-dependent DNA methyltransferase, partial [Rhodomicrobium sp.]
SKFVRMVTQLWEAMDTGDFAYAIEQKVVRFNGKLFRDAKVIPLEKEDIGELLAAAKADWREVEPAIFGTLLEQALDEKERARLGAHYTPRAYVERLVVVTVMEPLRQEWSRVQATAERIRDEAKTLSSLGDRNAAAKRGEEAVAVIRNFHSKLCTTRVLDPACGTGNFLYVALELMKRLEGEVLEALLEIGGQESMGWLDRQSVDPHQFLGLELNPRAAAIAELVIWLGYLQWHFKTKGAAPPEPILREFQNIKVMNAVLTWDGYPVPKVEENDGKRILTFPNAKRPDWPEADYIVGNPPFIGGKDIRAALGDDETKALWRVHPHINDSADFVMYWWDRAADIVAKGETQRFGFVTTNSITQVFSRRVVARHLEAKKPVSLLMAIPDHPWTKATDNAAAVRIAMTVATAGRHEGVLREVIREAKLDTDQPEIELSAKAGRINADLTVGVDVTSAEPLRANEGLSSPGVKLHGDGFIVTPQEAGHLGLEKRPGLDSRIRHYRNGRDITGTPRGVMVIDLFGLDDDEVEEDFPEVYQHILAKVKPERASNRRASYAANWWIFGEPRRELRPALEGLPRYIATVETAKHRVFVFLDGLILPDNMLVAISSDDAFHLGVLSSRVHVTWALRAGGWLGIGNDPRYSKSRCFDPFSFPDCSGELKGRIRIVADKLDASRKARQADHPGLTLTQMYNVLEKLKTGEALNPEDDRIKDQGLVLILKELHERLDALVFEAYGWPATLSDEEILGRLVALNKERSIEEKTGKVRWLRPDYQIPRFGSDAEKARLEEERRRAKEAKDRLAPKQGSLSFEDDLQEMKKKFPTGEELKETVEVMRVLEAAAEPMSIEEIARHFAQGKQIEKRVGSVVAALARLGHLSTGDGGKKVSLRSAA